MSVLENPSALTISYNPKNVESLRQGLQYYRKLIQQEDAFCDFYCHVTFALEENSDDSITDLLEDSVAKTIFTFCGRDVEKLSSEQKLNDRCVDPETAFFMRALLHPELEAELEQTAITLNTVSRRVNNSSEMWISDTEVLGLNLMFMLALKYPQYTYLLASYIVPYWDTEHAPFGEEVLAIVVSHHGYSHDMLKAFCYCDNHMARAKMFTLAATSYGEQNGAMGQNQSQSLLDIFRNQPEEFSTFKQMLKERFAAVDYLQYTDDSRHYNEDPIRSIVLSLVETDSGTECYDLDDKGEAMSKAIFIDGLADDAAADLKIEIEGYLGRQIVENKEEEEDEYSDIYYIYGTGIEQWKAFVWEEFDNGRQVWDYVITGENPDILDQVEPCDASALMKAGNYKLAEKIDYFVGHYESFHSELERIIYDLIADWTFNGDDDEKPNEAEERVKLFRMLDVIYCWNDKQGFDPNFIDKMVNEYEFFSDKEFMTRYNGDWKALFFHCVESFSGYSSNVEQSEATTLYQISLEHRDEVKTIIENGDFPQEHPEFPQEQPRETILGLCASIAHFDQLNGTKDTLNQYVLSALNEHLVAAIYDAIAQTSEFVCAPKIPEWQYEEPEATVLNQIKQDWLVVEQYFNGEHDDTEAALVKFEKHHRRSDKDTELFRVQPRYCYLRDYDNKAQKLLLAAQVLSKHAESPIQKFAERFVELWLRLAPTKTCRMLAYFYNISHFGNVDADEFHQQNQKLVNQMAGITDVGATAYVVENLISEVPSGADYQVVFALLFKQYQDEMALPEKQRVLHQALKVILQRYTQIFMAQLHKFNPELVPEYFENTLVNIIPLRVRQRIEDTIHDDRELSDEEKHDIEVARQYVSLKTRATKEQVDQLVKIMESRYIEDFCTPWGEAEVDFLFWYASDVLKDNLLQIYIHHSEMDISDLHYDRDTTQQRWLCERAYALGMSKIKLFEFIVEEDWTECLDIFPDQLELAPLTKELSTEDLHTLLVELAKLGNYEPLIATFTNHSSRRIRDLIVEINTGRYSKKDSDSIEVVEFGIFAEGGTPEQIEAAEQEKTAEEEDFVSIHSLEHRKETLLIEAEVGRTFGMRIGYFSDDRPEEEFPETMDLKVRVHHPYIHSHDGYLSEWDIELSLDCRSYVGWTFSHKSLCVPGIYRIDIVDGESNIIESKTFHVVEKRPILTDDLVERYQNDSLTQQHMGSINIHDNALNIIDVKDPCDTLNLGHRLSNNLVNIYSYSENNQLAFSELRLSEKTPKHWYVAPNQLRPFIEKRVKGKQLLLGSSSAISCALANLSLWQSELGAKSPIKLFQPDQAQADSVLAIHLQRLGFRLLFGYSNEGELCRILVAPQKVGLLRRLLLRMMAKVARNTIEDKGVPKAL